jgi:hypothetical protein
MKEIYFTYNPFTSCYIFYEGSHQHNRREFNDSQNPLKVLEDLVDKKRRSKLFLLGLPPEVLSKIEKLFRETKIELIK